MRIVCFFRDGDICEFLKLVVHPAMNRPNLGLYKKETHQEMRYPNAWAALS